MASLLQAVTSTSLTQEQEGYSPWPCLGHVLQDILHATGSDVVVAAQVDPFEIVRGPNQSASPCTTYKGMPCKFGAKELVSSPCGNHVDKAATPARGIFI